MFWVGVCLGARLMVVEISMVVGVLVMGILGVGDYVIGRVRSGSKPSQGLILWGFGW